MKKTLKEISKASAFTELNPFILLKSSATYPTIPENTSNFLTDYAAMKNQINLYVIHRRGSQFVELDTDEEDLQSDWYDLIDAITTMYLDSWARLYYALSLSYNPIWNVDGQTITERDEHENEMDYAQQIITNGTRSDSTTYNSVSYDSALEKETGKDEFSQGQQQNTIGAHKDTNTIGAEKETVTRQGNQGITQTQQMLNSEWEFRKKNFFEMVLNTVLDEVGFYYSGGVRV